MNAAVATHTTLKIETSARLFVEVWCLAYDISFSGSALSAVHTLIRNGVGRMIELGHNTDHNQIFDDQMILANFLFALTKIAKANNRELQEEDIVAAAAEEGICFYPFDELLG
jgi:hypothetical protein